jgi:hypothetical protein
MADADLVSDMVAASCRFETKAAHSYLAEANQ